MPTAKRGAGTPAGPRCTARVAWGALALTAERPESMPRWHPCTRPRDHRGDHEARWGEQVHRWPRMQGGARQGAGRPASEPTVQLAVRVPVRVVEAFRVRHGARVAARVRELLEGDL